MPGVVAVYTAADFKKVLTRDTSRRAGVRRREAHRARSVPHGSGRGRVPGRASRRRDRRQPQACQRRAPPRSRSTTSRCPRSSTCSGRSSRTSPKTHTNLPDNLAWDLTYSGEDTVKDAFDQADVVVKERILQQRLAPVPDRDTRRDRRLQPLRRSADRLAGNPEPALHPSVRLRRAWHARDQGARHLTRRRRRLRQQDQSLPGGLPGRRFSAAARAARALDRDAHREPADHDPRPRSALRRRSGRETRRHATGDEGHAVPRLRARTSAPSAPSRQSRVCWPVGATSGPAASPRAPSAC